MRETILDALEFVNRHGVVLASAKGGAPRLIDFIAGETIAGNWWTHPRAREIYGVLAAVQDSGDVLVCRLLDGKVTLVHRRLWPALVRLASKFAPGAIARTMDEHTAQGRHVTRATPFPAWVPPEVRDDAARLSEEAAASMLAAWLPSGPVRRTERGAVAKRRVASR